MWEMADTIQKVDGSWQTGQAGSSGGGKRIWMQLRAPDRDVGGQRVAGYLTLGNSFDCTLTFAAGFSNVWAVCCNTLAAALAQAKNQLQLRHTKNAPERIAEVQEVLQLARDYNRVVDGEVLKLMSTKFTMQQVWGLAAKLWPAKDEAKLPEPTRVARETFVYDYRKAPGAVEGTAFGALQAVTYYGSHRWVVRGTGKEAELLRAESNWWGRSQEFQQKAWNVLVNPDARKELETAKVYQLA
jgi:hypothetical protein